MLKFRRRFQTTPRSQLSPQNIDADVSLDPALVCSSAVSLSTSALFAALMLYLEQKGVLSTQDHQTIYHLAVSLLDTGPADDGGVTELARSIIKEPLRPN